MPGGDVKENVDMENSTTGYAVTIYSGLGYR